MTTTKTPPVTRLEPGHPIIRAMLATIELDLAHLALHLDHPPLTEDLLADGLPGHGALITPSLAGGWVRWITADRHLHVLARLRGDDRTGPTPKPIVDPIGAVWWTDGVWRWACTATREKSPSPYTYVMRSEAQRTVEWAWTR